MPKDIRSYFTTLSKQSVKDKTNANNSTIKKKPIRIIDSDDEELTSSSTEPKTKRSKTVASTSKSGSSSFKCNKNKNAIEILSSDSEDERKLPKQKSQHNEKQVLVADIFSSTPIKQSKVDASKKMTEKVNVKNTKDVKVKTSDSKHAEELVHDNENFKNTLIDLDDFENVEELENNLSSNMEHLDSSSRKRLRADLSDTSIAKKMKVSHNDSGMDPGQEAHEKKTMLYRMYLNRGGPKNHGKKELPKGKKDCLANLCFLRTGVLDSLVDEEFENLIKEHGGRVVHGVSKKVNYIVVGEQPGPAKLAKAESYKIPQLSEDELLDLILTKSGMDPKYCKAKEADEDLFWETDFDSISTDIKDVNDSNINTKLSSEVPDTGHPEIIKTQNLEIEKPLKIPKTEHKETITPKKKDKSCDAIQKSTTTAGSESKVQGCTLTVETENKIKKSAHTIKQTNTTTSTKSYVSPTLTLSEKYKPQHLKNIIGQQSEQSNLYKLKFWLENWHKNQDPKIKKSLIRPNPWAKSDNGAFYKCALLSGPPGVGKTTTATLVAKELGLDIVEFNASDTRSKKSLQEEVSQLLHNKTIAKFAIGETKMINNRVLIMDEVDGMAGNEDRGGIQELIQLIKNSQVPIICICNDRNHQKMRTLLNYCFDLRFTKPRLEQIKGAMMSICFKEKIKINPQALGEIIAGTDCDIRQTMNHLALLGTTEEEITTAITGKEANALKKDSTMGPWEVCRAVFTKSLHKDMSTADKARLFFYDYSLGPLFVQENYLRVQPENLNHKKTLLRAALSASSLSTSDIIDSKIRKHNNWVLLESNSFFASVFPGHYMSGNFTSQINFPSWLGKNSKKNKFNRLLSELQVHTRVNTLASKMAIQLDYLLPLQNAVLFPLQKKGADGINEAVSLMEDYNLLREDIDNMIELHAWTTKQNPMSKIDTKVKTAFTRAYNKRVTRVRFAPTSVASKKNAAQNALEEEDEGVVTDDESDDDIGKNAMIKVKKPTGKVVKTKENAESSNKNKSKKGKTKKSK